VPESAWLTFLHLLPAADLRVCRRREQRNGPAGRSSLSAYQTRRACVSFGRPSGDGSTQGNTWTLHSGTLRRIQMPADSGGTNPAVRCRVLARRNPTLSLSSAASFLLRLDERAHNASLLKAPPHKGRLFRCCPAAEVFQEQLLPHPTYRTNTSICSTAEVTISAATAPSGSSHQYRIL